MSEVFITPKIVKVAVSLQNSPTVQIDLANPSMTVITQEAPSIQINLPMIPNVAVSDVGVQGVPGPRGPAGTNGGEPDWPDEPSPDLVFANLLI